jgi:protein gp37
MTKIEWTDETWNPIVGCGLVSPGCTNCYAMQQAARIERMDPGLERYRGLTKPSKAGPVWTGKIGIAPDEALTKPLRWKSPRMIFVNSMSDLFHEAVPDEVIDRVFAVMALCPQHIFQVLTKRSKRMREYLSHADRSWHIAREFLRMWGIQRIIPGSILTNDRFPLAEDQPDDHPLLKAWPLSNIWLGISVEDQARADERIPDLLATPAAIRWISAEPLLGQVDLRLPDLVHVHHHPDNDKSSGSLHDPVVAATAQLRGPSLDWVVAGGESGKGARPMHPDWARSLRDQCASVGVPFFFKQWGSWAPKSACPEAWSAADYGQQFDCQQFDSDEGDGRNFVWRVGKARAGRLLDGIEHDALPEGGR